MWYRVGADFVVVVHLLFISFIVGGVFLTWRWPMIIWAHIPAVVYGALVEFAGFTCPLTLLENHLRQRAGEAGYRVRIHLALPGQGDLSTGARSWDASGWVSCFCWWRSSDTGASCAGMPHRLKGSVPRGNRRVRAFRPSALAPGSGPILACGPTRWTNVEVATALQYRALPDCLPQQPNIVGTRGPLSNRRVEAPGERRRDPRSASQPITRRGIYPRKSGRSRIRSQLPSDCRRATWALAPASSLARVAVSARSPMRRVGRGSSGLNSIFWAIRPS